MLVPILRPIKVVNVTGSTNDFNLYTATGNVGVVAGSITYPHNLYCFVTASIGATANTTPAFQTELVIMAEQISILKIPAPSQEAQVLTVL